MAFNPNAFKWQAFKIRPGQNPDVSMSVVDSPFLVTDKNGQPVTLFADGAALQVSTDKYVRVLENPSTKSQGLSS